MTFDSVDGYVLLFGGAGPGGRPLNDTWGFAQGTWTNLTSGPAPSPRWGSSLVYDPIDSFAVLFGGCIRASNCAQSDTWSYSKGHWANVTMPSGAPPIARYGASASWDAHTSSMILFGGCEPKTCPAKDTWQYSTGKWTAPPPPPQIPVARSFASLSYYAPLNGSVLVGGNGSGVSTDGLWEYTNGQWSNVTTSTSGQLPALPWGMASIESNMGWASGTPTEWPSLILVGGTAAGCPLCADPARNSTWVYEPTFSAAASALPRQLETGQPTGLSAATGGGAPPFAYLWRLGDGSLAFTEAVVHSYSSVGDHTVNLTVTDSSGVVTSSTLLIPVVSGPVASISVLPSDTDVGRWVEYNSTLTGGEPPISSIWSFGDFWTSNRMNTTHSYANPGHYLVSLTATDGLQGTTIAFSNVTVNAAVVVDLEPSTLAPIEGAPVQFAANPTEGTPPYATHWNFGDGVSSCEVAPAHTLSSAGNFTIELEVLDSVGGAAFENLTLAVSSAPQSTAEPTPGSSSGESSVPSLFVFTLALGLTVSALLAVSGAFLWASRLRRRRRKERSSSSIAAIAAATDEDWETARYRPPPRTRS